MSSKLISVIVVSSVSSYLLLTTIVGIYSNQKRINLNGHELVIDEKSNEWTINQIESSSKVVPSLEFRIASNSDDKVTIEFDSPFSWNNEFRNASSDTSKNLQKAVKNYFDELREKLKVRAEIKVVNVLVKPTGDVSSDDEAQTHFNLTVECKIEPKYQVTKILQCQVITANIVASINVNELSIFFYELSYQEVVVEDMDAMASNFQTNGALYDVTQTSASIEYEDVPSNLDFVVDDIRILNETANLFKIYAFINGNCKRDENFTFHFENYSIKNFKINEYFYDNAEIVIENVDLNERPFNAYFNSFGEEYFMTFTLQTFNIPFEHFDFELREHTMFDEIFKNFNCKDFNKGIIQQHGGNVDKNEIDELFSITTSTMNYEESTSSTLTESSMDYTTTHVHMTTTEDGIKSDLTTSLIETDREVKVSSNTRMIEGQTSSYYEIKRAEILFSKLFTDGNENENENSNASDERRTNKLLLILQFISLLSTIRKYF